MQEFTQELIAFGYNLSRPCEGEMPEFALYHETGMDEGRSEAEAAIGEAFAKNQIGHIEWVGTAETVTRMHISHETGEVVVMCMRGDKLAVASHPMFEVAARGISNVAHGLEAALNVAVDIDAIEQTLTDIGTPDALAELATLKKGAEDVKYVPRPDEAELATLKESVEIWKVWATSAVTSTQCNRYNPESATARFAGSQTH